MPEVLGGEAAGIAGEATAAAPPAGLLGCGGAGRMGCFGPGGGCISRGRQRVWLTAGHRAAKRLVRAGPEPFAEIGTTLLLQMRWALA